MAPRDGRGLTRKQQREQARQQRREAEAAEAAGAARRRRLIQLGAVFVAVAVVVAVIFVATSGKDSGQSSVPTTSSAKREASEAVASLLKGIPQEGNRLGEPHAPVTMQYYGDLECPYCQEFTLDALPGIVANEVRDGRLKIEYRSQETATREPATFMTQQVAAYAAGKQDLAWDYIELFYHEQGAEDTGYVTEGYLQGLARQVPGLKLAQWSAERADRALRNEVAEDERSFEKLIAGAGLTEAGTPTFAIGRTGHTLQYFSPPSLSESSGFEEAIDKLVPRAG